MLIGPALPTERHSSPPPPSPPALYSILAGRGAGSIQTEIYYLLFSLPKFALYNFEEDQASLVGERQKISRATVNHHITVR